MYAPRGFTHSPIPKTFLKFYNPSIPIALIKKQSPRFPCFTSFSVFESSIKKLLTSGRFHYETCSCIFLSVEIKSFEGAN